MATEYGEATNSYCLERLDQTILLTKLLKMRACYNKPTGQNACP